MRRSSLSHSKELFSSWLALKSSRFPQTVRKLLSSKLWDFFLWGRSSNTVGQTLMESLQTSSWVVLSECFRVVHSLPASYFYLNPCLLLYLQTSVANPFEFWERSSRSRPWMNETDALCWSRVPVFDQQSCLPITVGFLPWGPDGGFGGAMSLGSIRHFIYFGGWESRKSRVSRDGPWLFLTCAFHFSLVVHGKLGGLEDKYLLKSQVVFFYQPSLIHVCFVFY